MKSRIIKSLKIILFVGCIFISLGVIQDIVCPKFESPLGLRSGFSDEEENSIDVLFLGTSNMFLTINPVLLYEDTGITAFDFGSSSQSLNMTYMYLKEALKTQSPEVVCVEVLASRADFNNELYESGLRWGFTYFPTNIEKLEGIYNQLHTIDADFLSYIFPILRYKDRWKELTENDFTDDYATYWKGCEVSWNVTEVEYDDSYWEETEWELADSNILYLDKIRELCEEEGIELILFKSPTPSLWKNIYSLAIQEYADEYQLPFIDYNMKLDELGIDVTQDFRDAGHVNVDGSRKITKDFGEYLLSNYDLTDHRTGENNSWDQSVEEMDRRNANSALNSQKADMLSFIEKLSDEDYTIMFTICGEINADMREALMDYFEISGDIDGCIRVNGENVLTVSNQVEYSWHDTLEGQDYAMECVLQEADDGESVLTADFYVNGESCKQVENGINIIVYDNRLDYIVSQAGIAAD